MKLHSNAGMAIMIIALAGLMSLSLQTRSANASGIWYVATSGNDTNDCLSAATPCSTINGAIGKAGSDDTILVASGTYTSNAGNEVVLVSKSITLSGGWDATFTVQDKPSVIDGGNARRGVTVNSEVTASLDRFVVQHGNHDINDGETGGIQNLGRLTIHNSTIRDNEGFSGPGGIVNVGVLTATNSSVIYNVGGIYNDGGVYSNFRSSLILNNSLVGNNASNTVGGIYNSFGSIVLNNSTISRNSCVFGGCGIYNQYGGTVELNNSTVIENVGELNGAGVANHVGSIITLTNSIVTQNTLRYGGDESDCVGTISSAGYNIIGNTSGCSFAATPNDLLNINARGIFWGSYLALLSDSPAVDHGNPDGCKDNLGNVFTTDQRGTFRPLDGDRDGISVCDIGSYELDPLNPIRQIFLPVVSHNYCPDFFDDFSNSASGWPVGEDSYVRTEYLNGEYRVASKQGGYLYLFRAPTCNRQNYVVETDVRWEGTPGNGYGLVFGITSDFSQYYLFYVDTNFTLFKLYRRSPSGLTVINSGAVNVHNGATPNHFKVTRNGTLITLEGNGSIYVTWADDTIMGLTGVGLMSNPYSKVSKSDARFDNFRVTGLPSSAATGVQQGSRNIDTASPGLKAPTVKHVRLPDDLVPEVHK